MQTVLCWNVRQTAVNFELFCKVIVLTLHALVAWSDTSCSAASKCGACTPRLAKCRRHPSRCGSKSSTAQSNMLQRILQVHFNPECNPVVCWDGLCGARSSRRVSS